MISYIVSKVVDRNSLYYIKDFYYRGSHEKQTSYTDQRNFFSLSPNINLHLIS